MLSLAHGLVASVFLRCYRCVVLQREMVEALIDIEIATNLIKESGGVTSVCVTRKLLFVCGNVCVCVPLNARARCVWVSVSCVSTYVLPTISNVYSTWHE